MDEITLRLRVQHVEGPEADLIDVAVATAAEVAGATIDVGTAAARYLVERADVVIPEGAA